MAVFSAIASVIGAAASGIGAIGSGLGGLGGLLTAGAGIAGTALTYMGQKKAAAGAERAERLRERQMNLQAARDRRQTVRQAIIARSQALASATSQGAEGGSGIQGGMSQVTAQSASNIQGINQGQQIGSQMFAANRQISQGNSQSALGGAIQGIGTLFAQNVYGQPNDVNNRVWGWS